MRLRIIPVLLLKDKGLYKTRKFTNEVYVGDPINTVRIFNDKAVDELIFLDIGVARKGGEPDLQLLRDIASECFMPLSYGGGVASAEMVRELTAIGIEKVVINSAAFTSPGLVPELARNFGSSTLVGSIDVRHNWRGREQVCIHAGQDKIPLSPVEWAQELERRGIGEIMINSISRDGEMTGFDLDLVRRVAQAVSVPVIASGGASGIEDIRAVVRDAGAAAAAAGALFVFNGRHRAVLITYPQEHEREGL